MYGMLDVIISKEDKIEQLGGRGNIRVRGEE